MARRNRPSRARMARTPSPAIRRVSPLIAGIADEQKLAGHADVFFWAVFMGDVRLAREPGG